MHRLERIQARAWIALLNNIHQGANTILIPREISEFDSKCCLTSSNDQDLPPVSPQQQLMPPEGCLLTLRFRLWCWSSAKHSQTIYFVTKVYSKGKGPFFFSYSRLWKKKKKKSQFWQYFVSRTSCPKTKHSLKVEVAHLNISGMESFQF